MLAKSELRRALVIKQLKLSKREAALHSADIADKLPAIIDRTNIVRGIHAYSAIHKWREVDPHPFLEFLRDQYPDVKITVSPKAKTASFPAEKFDVILIPVVGFDTRCQRLGRGSGWYDRFLAGQSQAVKIGLAHEVCHVATLPVESHDVPLDYVVTEKEVYTAS